MNRLIVLNLLFLSFLLTLSAETFSQSENESLNRKSNRFLILPSHFLDPLNPAFQVGVERRIAKHSAIQAQYGLVLSREVISQYLDLFPLLWGPTYPEKSGHKFRLEYRFYFAEQEGAIHPYVAGEIQYLDITTLTHAKFLASDEDFPYDFDVVTDVTTYEDVFTYRKRRASLGAKWGILLLLTPTLTLDFFVGAGINYRHTIHLDRLNENDWFTVPGFNHHWAPGRTFFPNLPAGFSLGFQF